MPKSTTTPRRAQTVIVMPATSLVTTRTAYDAETDAHVEVTSTMRNRALRAHQAADVSQAMFARALQVIADEKLYLALDCSSFKEYAEEVRSMSYTSAKRYIQIARRAHAILPGHDPLLLTEGPPEGLEDDTEGPPEGLGEDPLAKLMQMGVTKAEHLMKLGDDDLADLLGGKEVTMPSGKTLDWEELQTMTRAKMQKEFRAEKRKLRDRAAEQEERARAAESERDHVAEERDRLARQVTDLGTDLMRHQPATKTEEKRSYLNRARALLAEARAVLINAEVTPEDPLELRELLADAVGDLAKLQADAHATHDAALLSSDPAHLPFAD